MEALTRPKLTKTIKKYMVYTDGVHLIADTIPELHEFACRIDLNLCWYKNTARAGNILKKPHYDLMLAKRSRADKMARALATVAIVKTSRELVIIIQANVKYKIK